MKLHDRGKGRVARGWFEHMNERRDQRLLFGKRALFELCAEKGENKPFAIEIGPGRKERERAKPHEDRPELHERRPASAASFFRLCCGRAPKWLMTSAAASAPREPLLRRLRPSETPYKSPAA